VSTNAKVILPDNKHSFQWLMFRQHHVYNDKYFQTGALPFPSMWAISLRHHQMVRIGASHGLPVAIDEIEVSFGSKDAPVLDRAEPGDPNEANKDRNQLLSSSAFVNPYFRALRTPF